MWNSSIGTTSVDCGDHNDHDDHNNTLVNTSKPQPFSMPLLPPPTPPPRPSTISYDQFLSQLETATRDILNDRTDIYLRGGRGGHGDGDGEVLKYEGWFEGYWDDFIAALAGLAPHSAHHPHRGGLHSINFLCITHIQLPPPLLDKLLPALAGLPGMAGLGGRNIRQLILNDNELGLEGLEFVAELLERDGGRGEHVRNGGYVWNGWHGRSGGIGGNGKSGRSGRNGGLKVLDLNGNRFLRDSNNGSPSEEDTATANEADAKRARRAAKVMTKFANALMAHPSLETLSLKRCGFGDGSDESNVDNIEGTDNTNNIDNIDNIDNTDNIDSTDNTNNINNIDKSIQGRQFLQLILDAITRKPTGLKSLYLNDNRLSSKGAILLSNFIASNPPLQELYLTHNHFSNGDAALIANALKTNTRLQILNLANNQNNQNKKFTGEGVNWVTALRKAVYDDASLNDLVDCNHTCHLANIGIPMEYNNSNTAWNTWNGFGVGEGGGGAENRKRKIQSALRLSPHLNLEYFANVPVELMPEVLELLQSCWKCPVGGMVKIGGKEQLTKVYEVMRYWNLPSLYIYVNDDNERGSPDGPGGRYYFCGIL